MKILFLTVIWTLICCTKEANEIQVVWLAPRETPPGSPLEVNASTSLGAFALAIEKVYNNSIMPKDSMNIVYLDSGCDSKQSLGVFTTFLFHNDVDVIFGPPCTVAMSSIAELASYRNIPVFGWLSNEESLDNKTKLDTLVRTVPPLSGLGSIMLLIFLQFNWYRFVVISASSPECQAYATAITKTFEALSFIGFSIVHHYSLVENTISDENLDSMLNAIQHEGRIVILIIPKDYLRRYMIRADLLGMTGGDYQYLFVQTTILTDSDVQLLSSQAFWKCNDGYDESARRGLENVLFFDFGDFDHNVEEWASLAMDSANRLFGSNSNIPSPVYPDIYSVFLHDAVHLYALVMNQTTNTPQFVNGTTIAKATQSVSFQGLSGNVAMSSIADRYPSLKIYDLNLSDVMEIVLTLEYTMVAGTVIPVSTSNAILWGNGLTSEEYTPPDTPACGFFNEFCPENSNQAAIFGGVAAAVVAVLAIIFIVYVLWRREQAIQNMTWRVKHEDLDFNIGKRNKSFMNISSTFPRRNSVMTNTGTESVGAQNTTNDSLSDFTAMRCESSGTGVLARYQENTVVVKYLKKKKLKLDRKLLKEMNVLTNMKNSNLVVLTGLCTDTNNICVLWEFCSKGSIQDVKKNDGIKLDTMFKLSIATDIAKGLEYLHKSDLKYHGNLKSSNCVIDSRWTCKLTDFGPRTLSEDNALDLSKAEESTCKALYWTAPELLRRSSEKRNGSHAADIYAYGIICKELLTLTDPYASEHNLTPKEIIERVMNPVEDKFLRPRVIEAEIDGFKTAKQVYSIRKLIERCWAEDPKVRPNTKSVLQGLHKINPFKKTNVIENMITMMEKYSNQLEDLVSERTQQLEEEKLKTDALLYRMLPRKIAEDLKVGNPITAEAFDLVTIYFSDIVGFTTIAGDSTPMQVVGLLNSLYTLFDDTIQQYDVYKVETIGDAYMIVSGLPERNGNKHAPEIAAVSLKLREKIVTDFKIPHLPERCLQIRIGLHTGPVVAGVVGLTMPRYCLFGDTVNTASRMESNGQAQKIHISSSTHHHLCQQGGFKLTARGELEVKGKGKMLTYWLEGWKNEDEPVSTKGILPGVPDGNDSDCFKDDIDDITNVENYYSYFKLPPFPDAGDIFSKAPSIDFI